MAVGGAFAIGGSACVVLGGLALLGTGADETARDDAAPGASGTAPGAPGAPAATTLVETSGDGEAPPADADGARGGERPPTAGASPPGAGGGVTWQCTASSSVRVCGFANACNYQMVFGNGFGKDRYLASTQAKNACEGMARAKGGSTVCVVQCTPR